MLDSITSILHYKMLTQNPSYLIITNLRHLLRQHIYGRLGSGRRGWQQSAVMLSGKFEPQLILEPNCISCRLNFKINLLPAPELQHPPISDFSKLFVLAVTRYNCDKREWNVEPLLLQVLGLWKVIPQAAADQQVVTISKCPKGLKGIKSF